MTKNSTKKFYVENLGCAKNQVDSEQMGAALIDKGWDWVEQPEDSDVILVNTCGFIKAAREESVDVLLEMRKHYPGKKVIAAGCLVERYQDELPKSIPELDGFLGARAPEEIVKLVGDMEEKQGTSPVRIAPTAHPQLNRPKLLSLPGSAYVKIAEGCSHDCSFCAIPQFKGKLSSRPIADIVSEIAGLLSQGKREIILVSQDTAGYGSDWDGQLKLVDLVREILKLEHSFWLRLLYIHPDIFPYELLDIMEQDSRLIPYLDIPLQHVSQKQLRAMNRRGSLGQYSELLGEIRSKLPHAVIRTTYLTGFPGESKEDFDEFSQFQTKVGVEWLGVFCYSREEGTKAYDWHAPFISSFLAKAAKQRKAIVEERQRGIAAERMKRFVGQELDVLIEECYKDEQLSLGRAYLQAPEVDGSVLVYSREHAPGSLIRCKVIKSNGLDLEVQVLDAPPLLDEAFAKRRIAV